MLPNLRNASHMCAKLRAENGLITITPPLSIVVQQLMEAARATEEGTGAVSSKMVWVLVRRVYSQLLQQGLKSCAAGQRATGMEAFAKAIALRPEQRVSGLHAREAPVRPAPRRAKARAPLPITPQADRVDGSWLATNNPLLEISPGSV